MPPALAIRCAVSADIPVLRDLINASVRRLQSGDYSPAQIDAALRTVFGVDSQLIADGTYLLVEAIVDSNKKTSYRRLRRLEQTQNTLWW